MTLIEWILYEYNHHRMVVVQAVDMFSQCHVETVVLI